MCEVSAIYTDLIFPPIQKMGGQHKGVNGESLHPGRNVHDTSFSFLRDGRQH